MKKLLTAVAAVLITSQANAMTYNVTYSYERDGFATGTFYYMWSRPLTTALPDPGHIYNSPPSVTNHAGGADPTFGTGTLDTVTGEIALNPVNVELVIPSANLGYIGYSYTLHGSFSGNTYTNTSTSLTMGSYVCEDGTALVNACISGYDTPRVDPDGIVFSALAPGGMGSFFQKDGALPFTETRLEITIGDAVAPVPVPAAAWLFGSGLLGLAGLGRKRSK